MFLAKMQRRWRWWKLKRAGAIIPWDIQSVIGFFEGEPRGLKCGKGAYFEEGAKMIIGSFKGNVGKITLGDYFYCNRYTLIDAVREIRFGDRVQVGPFCYITDFDHDVFSRLDRPFHRPIATASPVVIEDEVWIGAHVTILKGVCIGRRSVIGAGSVVTRDIPPDYLAIGIPARPIRRLDDNGQTKIATSREEAAN